MADKIMSSTWSTNSCQKRAGDIEAVFIVIVLPSPFVSIFFVLSSRVEDWTPAIQQLQIIFLPFPRLTES